MHVSDEHPNVWQDLTVPLLVRSPALQLTEDLSVLVLGASRSWINSSQNSAQLHRAYQMHSSTQIRANEAPLMVPNVPLQPKWIEAYKLPAKSAHLRLHAFTALVHFGDGHFTLDHFETCAAATYGMLLEGRKEWGFTGMHGEQFSVVQEKGDTVYVPPGWIHNVRTLSNGSILVGETAIAAGSPDAFIRRSSSLVAGRVADRMNPAIEAQRLLDHFNIKISARVTAGRGTWNSAPAMVALRAYVAQQRGGTARRDALGRRRKRKAY